MVCLFTAGALAFTACSSGSSNGGPAAKYKIGGTVTGLAGSGLALRSSLGDVLPVSANGAFEFPTQAESGTAYTVTVSQHPTSPWQTCAVANGGGAIGNAHVTNVAVSCTTNRYAVGGTVAGLAAGGTLVLQNNAGDDLTVTADGAFTFAATAPSGSSYAVTIKSKPASQTCQVARGNGTVAGAAIGDVAVTCGTDTFTVGGTVNGLAAGRTLVLQNNGADDKTITANGPYSFTTAILSGAPYAVTVLTQPAAQTCTVSNGSGTVGGAPVTNADVSCVVNTYAIGGSVAGLVGTGLVLHNDVTGEDLSVAASATTFAFTQKVAAGATVNVTVGTQPSSPAEACRVAGSPVTVGTSDVTSLAVSCTSAIQSWQAPTTWGGLWPDSATMVQHAYFDGTQIVEAKGIPWTVAGGAAPAQRELTGLPAGSRWGAGPFSGPRFQSTGGDAGLDLPANMLACAVVKPDYNAVENGNEHVIMAKGIQGDGGWMLLQRHHMFNFYYHYGSGATSFVLGNAYTPTYFADASIVDNGPLNPTYVIVCGGRDGDTLVVAANSFPDASLQTPLTTPGAPLFPGLSAHHLTIGAYDDGTHPYRGRVYETAVWNEPATAANIQAKFNAILGLPEGAHYTRNREGPFTGSDGKYHTAWRHAPRAYPADGATGFPGGFLFGLQGWNRLTRPYDPPAWDAVPQVNPVIALGESLDHPLWTRTGGAAVQANQVAAPGDSEQSGADRVTLPSSGDALSAQLGFFDDAGPIHGMMWIQPVAASGTLRVSTTRADSGSSQHDIDLSLLPAGQWTRVWLNGLSNDGSQTTPAVLSLTNVGSGSLDFYAWGIDLTQIGRGADLGLFDPGLAMYDWGGSHGDGTASVDILQLAKVPSSTAATGFCLSVEAQPPEGLAWTAPFFADRSPLTWVSDVGSEVVNVFVAGTGKAGILPLGDLCAFLSTAPTMPVCWHPTWSPGSRHTAALCATPDGVVTLYADGLAVGTPAATGSPPPDLSAGHVLLGGSRAVAGSSTWQGFVTKATICASADLGACR